VEHSADPACAQDRRDDCPDEPDQEAEVPGRPRWDAVRTVSNALDASVGVRRDEAADAARRPCPELAGVDAEKLADREQAVPVQDAFQPANRLARLAQLDAAVELCRRDAAPSAEQSCAEQASAVALEQKSLAARPDAALVAESAAEPKQ